MQSNMCRERGSSPDRVKRGNGCIERYHMAVIGTTRLRVCYRSLNVRQVLSFSISDGLIRILRLQYTGNEPASPRGSSSLQDEKAFSTAVLGWIVLF